MTKVVEWYSRDSLLLVGQRPQVGPRGAGGMELPLAVTMPATGVAHGREAVFGSESDEMADGPRNEPRDGVAHRFGGPTGTPLSALPQQQD
jgi:hypothetical protein